MTELNTILNDRFVACSQSFGAFASCLESFAKNQISVDVSMQAFVHIEKIVESLANGMLRNVRQDIPESPEQCHARVESQWCLVLGCLGGICWDPRLPVRTKGMDLLFATLNNKSHGFTQVFWFEVFDSLFSSLFGRLFLTAEEDAAARVEWLKGSCLNALIGFMEMCRREELQQCFPQIIKFVLSMISYKTDTIMAGVGIEALRHQITAHGSERIKEHQIIFTC